ncbi:hypothetical protein BGZ49_006178 [Haplosporangium sp. Z 27]|nr:hypothetical protein BGZ49_006178 [Haplosporangium sp. Z 27]
MSNIQSKNEHGHPSGKVHSTHSSLETFDQATREQASGEAAYNNSQTNSTTKSFSDNKENKDQWHHPGNEKEANSAVQLDRDMHQSRRMSDSDRQKASGTSRSGSWSTGQPYVE